jgi:trans-AT polyketide synthase, acyltransferase and oxidoreductase domains
VLTETKRSADALRQALFQLDRPFSVVDRDGDLEVAPGQVPGAKAYVPACAPETLGDPAFRRDHGVRFAYATGAMANGIASVELVAAASKAGCLGFFGSAGLSPATVEAAIDKLQKGLGDKPYGVNLIHSPNEPKLEQELCSMFLRKGVRLVEASAYMDLTPAIVRYRTAGISRGPDGEPVTPNRVVAKVSRAEVASKFFAPPPEKYLRALVDSRDLTAEQAELAARIPMAQDVTAEADSGGHTDNRPAISLYPSMIALRDRFQEQYGYANPLRVGAAGGISTPAAASAAYLMGASYVLTGSVNQSCVESGSSDVVRKMLAQAEQADVAMAPAADMFEMGVKVQILKRGTMFAMRAAKLYEVYRAYPSIEAIPAAEREKLEKELFRAPLAQIWADTEKFFLTRDPAQAERASKDPKHKMALVFRWYLGLSSRWANAGEPTRQLDYQVWCGPAMGAFNEWAKGSFLEAPANRTAAAVAMNILHGAAVLTRIHFLRCQNVNVDAKLRRIVPRPLEELEA